MAESTLTPEGGLPAHPGGVQHPAGPGGWRKARLRHHAGSGSQHPRRGEDGPRHAVRLDQAHAGGRADRESDERPDPALDDQRRRYYRLTGIGQRAMRAEAERLERQVAVARLKHVLEGQS